MHARSNVFMDKAMVAKIADFGMVTNSPQSTDACGTIQWGAPEVLLNVYGTKSVYDKRCDVFR